MVTHSLGVRFFGAKLKALFVIPFRLPFLAQSTKRPLKTLPLDILNLERKQRL